MRRKILFFLFAINILYAREYDIAFWQQIYKDSNSATFSSNDFLYDIIPNKNGCIAGVMKQQAKDRSLKIINKIRELHELSPLSYDSFSQSQVEEASLVMYANGKITHDLDSSYDCYSEVAKEGAGSSNIYSGWKNQDSLVHLLGWLKDLDDISAIKVMGHRRWMINPFQTKFSYGQAFGYSAMKTFSFSPSTNAIPTVDFVAYPYEKYPFMLFDKSATWSFTIIEYKNWMYANEYDYFGSAQITVKDKTTNATLATNNQTTNYQGYGVPNVLLWTVNGIEYDKWYSVNISNVKMRGGGTRNFTYDVYIDKNGVVSNPVVTTKTSIVPIINYLLSD